MSEHDEMPELCDNESDNEEDWLEMEQDESEPTRCLFCTKVLDSITKAIEHLKQEHNFDLPGLKDKFNLDQYSYIKMINYIRSEHPLPENILKSSSILWGDDKYLKPVETELWLMLDLDDLDNEEMIEASSNITLTIDEYRQMKNKIQDLTKKLKESDDQLEASNEKIKMMKESFVKILDQQDVTDKKPDKINDIKETLDHCVGSVSVDDDVGYFNTYSHFGIHHDMLCDQVRTLSYREAILRNAEQFKDKTVLDVGCGTSILSMFSSKAGAKEVIAVDQSDIIYQAMDIVRRNNIDNIKFVKGRLEDTELPVKKVDIIVSEFMGYLLLFEGMMDSVIYARKNYLSDGGIILPNRCNISILGYGDLDRHNDMIKFWDDVYGFDMKCMKREALKEATVEICKPQYIITNSNIIANFDLMTVDVDCPNFTYNFSLTVKKDSKLTALVGYFDTFFELPNHVEFSTSPYSTATHWKQVVFYLEEPRDVKEGQVIEGKFICKRDRKDVRSLLISIHYFDKVFNYALN